jgi:hypothetical protein
LFFQKIFKDVAFVNTYEIIFLITTSPDILPHSDLYSTLCPVDSGTFKFLQTRIEIAFHIVASSYFDAMNDFMELQPAARQKASL